VRAAEQCVLQGVVQVVWQGGAVCVLLVLQFVLLCVLRVLLVLQFVLLCVLRVLECVLQCVLQGVLQRGAVCRSSGVAVCCRVCRRV